MVCESHLNNFFCLDYNIVECSVRRLIKIQLIIVKTTCEFMQMSIVEILRV